MVYDLYEEISTKGYDFYWDVAVDGYQWLGKDSLAFAESLNRNWYYLPSMPPEKYEKDRLLFDGDLRRNILTVHEVHPEPIDTQAPWLVEKGELVLCKEDPHKTPYKEWERNKEREFIPSRQYRPLSTRTLHRRFASLNTESLETEILSFANKYGSLGQTVHLRTKRFGEEKGDLVQGESLHRWHREINRMGVLVAIWDLIHQKEAGKLGQIILWRYNPDCVEVRLKWRYQEEQYEISKWDGQQKVAGFGHISQIVANRNMEPDFFNEYERGYSIGPAWYWLGEKLSAHLHRIRPKLEGLNFDEREVNFIPRTFLDALWLLFMLEVQGKTNVARCRYCGEWFELERSTKTYCSGNCRRLAKYHRDKSKAKKANHERSHNKEVQE